ncbi:MAG TPA: phosphatase PAP2 family protein [Candidatus Nanoarchaeia archaeon]|nr:phosphatase PAP2 family protein [Candidatus Nanoarchaeia archaeon]
MVGDKKEEKESDSKVKFDYRSSRFFAVLFPAIYAAVLGIFFLVYDIIPGPEFVVLIFLIYAAYNNKTWHFVKDWIPFLLVFMSYEAMNGLVGKISHMNLHTGPYNLELFLFAGHDPSLILQQNFRFPILDYMGAFFYTIYFFVPTIFGFVVWRESHKDYWKYIVSLGILTYSALVTFLVYPVAPPWLNPQLTPPTIVPGVIRILTNSVDKSLGVPVYKTIYDFLGPNLYAAFPSLHSALPWLVFLFSFKIWKWQALPVIVLPVGTWFSAIYLGEHYFVDVLGGITYATIAFFVVVSLLPFLSKHWKFLGKHIPTA